jgi:hypothetical protein
VLGPWIQPKASADETSQSQTFIHQLALDAFTFRKYRCSRGPQGEQPERPTHVRPAWNRRLRWQKACAPCPAAAAP